MRVQRQESLWSDYRLPAGTVLKRTTARRSHHEPTFRFASVKGKSHVFHCAGCKKKLADKRVDHTTSSGLKRSTNISFFKRRSVLVIPHAADRTYNSQPSQSTIHKCPQAKLSQELQQHSRLVR